MSTVRVKAGGQVTLPNAIRERAGLSVGDLLEAKIENGNIVLRPQSLANQQIAESQQQIKRGEFYGPFDTAEEMVKSLRRGVKPKRKAAKRKIDK
jgi:AbrB family looped-hinge helix DNA binding protein